MSRAFTGSLYTEIICLAGIAMRHHATEHNECKGYINEKMSHHHYFKEANAARTKVAREILYLPFSFIQ